MLSPEQKQVETQFVTTRDNNLVIALPGSGKSTVSIASVIRLILEVPVARPYLITFTKAATESISSKLRLRLNKALLARVSVSTFHSALLMQYKQLPHARGVLFGPPQSTMIIRAMRVSRYGGTYEEAKQEIDLLTRKLKPTGTSPLLVAYMDLLDKYQKIDLNLVCIEVVNGLRHGHIQPLNITHLVVDEFQDTDEVQLAWMRCHAERGISVTAVGDDDQSIYRFRGGLGYHIMSMFIQDFKAKIFSLSNCYRCGSVILGAADRLIQHNQQRMEKVMNAAAGHEGIVQIFKSENRVEQYSNVLDSIVAKQGSWAILSRNGANLDEIELELGMRKIAFKRLSGDSLWDTPAADSTMRLLDMIITQRIGKESHNLMAYLGMDEETIDSLMHYQGMIGLAEIALETSMPSNYKKLLLSVVALGDNTYDQAKIESNLKRLMTDIEHLIKQKRELGIIRAIFTMITKRQGSGWIERLSSFVHEFSARKSKQPTLDPTVVALTTLHGSKGLEFDNVAIMGMCEGVYPSKDVEEIEDIEEERRLCFVGMTRAIHRLEMYFYGDPNMFIDEVLVTSPDLSVITLEKAQDCA